MVDAFIDAGEKDVYHRLDVDTAALLGILIPRNALIKTSLIRTRTKARTLVAVIQSPVATVKGYIPLVGVGHAPDLLIRHRAFGLRHY